MEQIKEQATVALDRRLDKNTVMATVMADPYEYLTEEAVTQGWQMAEVPRTGFRVLVRPTGHPRPIRAWEHNFGRDLEIRNIDTVVEPNREGVQAILAGVGSPRGKGLVREEAVGKSFEISC